MKASFNYVDAFVVPVKKKHIAAYKKMAKQMAKISISQGALSYNECMADDVQPGEVTSFPQSVKLKKDEVVFFAWMTYKNRTHRDQVMKKVMADPRMETMFKGSTMPFDGMRMFWGGFKPIVKA